MKRLKTKKHANARRLRAVQHDQLLFKRHLGKQLPCSYGRWIRGIHPIARWGHRRTRPREHKGPHRHPHLEIASFGIVANPMNPQIARHSTDTRSARNSCIHNMNWLEQSLVETVLLCALVVGGTATSGYPPPMNLRVEGLLEQVSARVHSVPAH